MKSVLLAGGMIVVTASCATAQSGNIWFGTGPYKSTDDARLARSTIPQCPAAPEPPAQTSDDNKQQ